jgi:hypothetical protein
LVWAGVVGTGLFRMESFMCLVVDLLTAVDVTYRCVSPL